MSDPGTSFPTTAEPRLRILIPLIVGCAFFMEGLDSTMIAVAIPAMAADLGETPLRLQADDEWLRKLCGSAEWRDLQLPRIKA